MSIQKQETSIDRAIASSPTKLLTIKEFINAINYDISALYIDKFWLSLNEQTDNEFGIYLDMPLIKMIGFAAKDDKLKKRNCVNLLKTFAKDGIDYIIDQSKHGAQLHTVGNRIYYRDNYYLTSDCFRRLILKANTKYSDKVRDEYMKFEELCAIYNTYKSIFKEKQSLVQYEEKEKEKANDDRNMIEYMFDNQSIQIIKHNDKFMFIGKQIAKLLGYKETRRAINMHIKPRNKLTYEQFCTKIGGGPIRTPLKIDKHSILIDEAGLYSLILRSKLPIAEKFQIWVTEDILPSIRRTGEYKLQKQLQIKDNEYQQQLQLERSEHQKQLANYEREMARLKRLANLPRIDEKISTDSLLYIATNSEMMKQNIFKVGHVKRATHKAMKERLHTYRTGYADPLRLVKLYVVRNATAIDAFFKDISQHYKQPADKAKELVTMPYEWLCAYLDKLITNNQSIIEDINARTMNEYEQAMAKQPDIQFLSDEEWPGQASIEPQEEEKRDTPDYIKPDQTIDYNKFIDKILRANGIKEGAKVQWIKFKKLSTTEKKQYNINIDYNQIKNTIKDKAESYKITFKCTK